MEIEPRTSRADGASISQCSIFGRSEDDGFPGSVTARCCQAQEAHLRLCVLPRGGQLASPGEVCDALGCSGEEHISVFQAMGASTERVAPARSLSVRDCRLQKHRAEQSSQCLPYHTVEFRTRSCTCSRLQSLCRGCPL